MFYYRLKSEIALVEVEVGEHLIQFTSTSGGEVLLFYSKPSDFKGKPHMAAGDCLHLKYDFASSLKGRTSCWASFSQGFPLYLTKVEN